MPRPLHSTKGIGIREYMENAITKLSRSGGRVLAFCTTGFSDTLCVSVLLPGSVFLCSLIVSFSFLPDRNSVHNFRYRVSFPCPARY